MSRTCSVLTVDEHLRLIARLSASSISSRRMAPDELEPPGKSGAARRARWHAPGRHRLRPRARRVGAAVRRAADRLDPIGIRRMRETILARGPLAPPSSCRRIFCIWWKKSTRASSWTGAGRSPAAPSRSRPRARTLLRPVGLSRSLRVTGRDPASPGPRSMMSPSPASSCAAPERMRVRPALREPRAGRRHRRGRIPASRSSRLWGSQSGAPRRGRTPSPDTVLPILHTARERGVGCGDGGARMASPFRAGSRLHGGRNPVSVSGAALRRQLLIHRLIRSQRVAVRSDCSAIAFPSSSVAGRVRFALSTWVLLVTAKVYFSGVTSCRPPGVTERPRSPDYVAADRAARSRAGGCRQRRGASFYIRGRRRFRTASSGSDR
jgi:hypothetical protein